MSSEVHKYIEEALNKNKNLFNAQVLDFPNDKTIDKSKDIKTKNDRILLVIGLYANLS